MREPQAERGFTLIELMMVVAIIALLAAVVVPMFTGQANKVRGKMEVASMFTELQTKEETYKQEAGAYLPAVGTTLTCFATPQPAGANFQTLCITSGSDWEKLRIRAPENKMRCSYSIVTGAAGDALTPPTGFKNSAGVVSATEPTLASSWWYMTAECDEDAAGGTNALYYASSVDSTLQIQNSGS